MSRRFRFRLARLERVRAIEERVARATWSRAEQEAAEAETEYATRRDAIAEARAQLTEARSETGPLDLDELLLAERAIDGMVSQLRNVREAALTRRGQAESLLRDWRERKTGKRALEQLRSKAKARHAATELEDENREQDELALMRASRPGRKAAETDSRNRGPLAD